MTPGNWANSPCCLLTKGKGNRIHAQPWTEPRADDRAFYSDDAKQLAAWLEAGRGQICPNSVGLVDG